MAEYRVARIFYSPLFKVMAGTNEEGELFVHKAILDKSPVFNKMCSDDFKEVHQYQLNLPEDGYHEIACLLQFLYSGDFSLGPREGDITGAHQGGEAALFAARVYLLADKYQIKDLKTRAAAKVAAYCQRGLPIRLVTDGARLIYNNTVPADTPFRELFMEVAREKLRTYDITSDQAADQQEMAALKEIFWEGGELAWAIFQAQRSAFLPF